MYRFAEGYAIKIVPLFLKASVADGGLGLSTQDIGLVYGTFGAGAFILGSLLAGYYISAFGLRKTLFSLCCAFNIPFLVYFLLALYQPSDLWIIGMAIVSEYLGYGFGFVGIDALYDAASGSRQTSDGTLCFCYRYYESGGDASRNDERIPERLAGLSRFLYLGTYRYHTGFYRDLAGTFHISGRKEEIKRDFQYKQDIYIILI